MKTCFKCKKKKLASEFYRHERMADGLLGKCKECTKEDVKKNRESHRLKIAEYERQRFKLPQRKAAIKRYRKTRRKRHPQKIAAAQAIKNAIRSGRMKMRPCEVCGNQRAQAHHDDYSKPLDVVWLCFKHHRERHGQVVVADF